MKRYEFMLENRNIFPIVEMARILKVSRSGYHKWLISRQDDSLINDDGVMQKIRKLFFLHKSRAGAIKINKDLKEHGITVSDRTVSRYMRKMGLKTVYSRPFKKTTNSNHGLKVNENLVSRNFKVDKPNKVWVSDITYIKAFSGWLYFCVIIDLYNREVIGWSIKHNINTGLVLEALWQAVKKRNPEAGLIFHSDQGSQYASNRFRKALKMIKAKQSMSRKGDCWDNAVAESFFKTLKIELIYCSAIFNMRQCNILLFEYIEIYYNHIRRHSFLGYESPLNFAEKMAA